MFIEKGVLAWFNSCNYGNALCDHDTEIMEMVALTALFRASLRNWIVNGSITRNLQISPFRVLQTSLEECHREGFLISDTRIIKRTF